MTLRQGQTSPASGWDILMQAQASLRALRTADSAAPRRRRNACVKVPFDVLIVILVITSFQESRWGVFTTSPGLPNAPHTHPPRQISPHSVRVETHGSEAGARPAAPLKPPDV